MALEIYGNKIYEQNFQTQSHPSLLFEEALHFKKIT